MKLVEFEIKNELIISVVNLPVEVNISSVVHKVLCCNVDDSVSFQLKDIISNDIFDMKILKNNVINVDLFLINGVWIG